MTGRPPPAPPSTPSLRLTQPKMNRNCPLCRPVPASSFITLARAPTFFPVKPIPSKDRGDRRRLQYLQFANNQPHQRLPVRNLRKTMHFVKDVLAPSVLPLLRSSADPPHSVTAWSFWRCNLSHHCTLLYALPMNDRPGVVRTDARFGNPRSRNFGQPVTMLPSSFDLSVSHDSQHSKLTTSRCERPWALNIF